MCLFLSLGKGETRPFVTRRFAKKWRNIVGTELWTERTLAYREHCHCSARTINIKGQWKSDFPKTFSLRSLLNLQEEWWKSTGLAASEMRKLRPKLRPQRIWTARIQKYCKSVEKRKLRQHGPSFLPGETQTTWSEWTAKMVMGVVGWWFKVIFKREPSEVKITLKSRK